MWLHSVVLTLFMVLLNNRPARCIVDKFNASLRDYSVKEETNNSTNVRTLQKDQLARYADFAPVRNPIKFKEIPDNALSSSSHSRGLLHHDSHHGYGLVDYDDPHYGHDYEYHIHEPHHDHGLDHDYHHGSHHYGHHLVYGHHKHIDHALAAKTVLWPIAGIALLGAAAALVSNPVLLQLGVVSGRRKRRDTESYDLSADFVKHWPKTKDNVATNEQITETTDKLITKTTNKLIERIFKEYDKNNHFVREDIKENIPTNAVFNNKKISSVNKVKENADNNFDRGDNGNKHYVRVALKSKD